MNMINLRDRLKRLKLKRRQIGVEIGLIFIFGPEKNLSPLSLRHAAQIGKFRELKIVEDPLQIVLKV